jgi:hypothetical protein
MAAIDDITNLYVGYFNRAPDPAGLNFWIAQANAGASLAGIAQSFAQVAESTSLYSYLAAPLVGSPVSFLNSVYLNLFGRSIDAAGQTYWTAQLANPAIPVGRIIVDIISGAQGDDALVVANKQAVGKAFTQKVVDLNAVFDLNLAKNAFAGVTKDSATVDTAIAANDDAIADSAGGAGGQTFNLTTGVDNFVGTGANDTFNAYIGAAGSTLTGSDIVNGSGGTKDVLSLTTDGGAPSLTAAAISNIEIFQIRDVGGGGTYDFSTVIGETSVVNNRSTSAVTFNNIATGATLTILGDNSVTHGATTFTMAAATNPVVINVDNGVKGGNITRNTTGEATITVNSTGLANTIGVLDVDTGTAVKSLTINATTNLTATLAADYAAGSTLTISGAASSVNLGGATLSANFASVNASGLTAGGATVGLGAATTAFTGGGGNDTVTIGALVFNSTTKVDAGAGSGDILDMSDQAALTAATVPNLLGFEILRLSDDNDGALDTFNVALLSGITGVQLNADSAGDGYSVQGLTAAQAGAITIRGTQTVAPTFGVTGATTVGQIDTLGITIDDGNPLAVSTITVADINAAGVENLNFTANDNLTVTALTGATALTNSTITGSGAVNITTGALALNVNTAINASALTGAFTFNAAAGTINGIAITGSSTKANTLTGTAQADTLTGGAGNDTFTGGNGVDAINLGSGGDDIVVLDGIVAAANRDVITGFTANNTAYTAGSGIDRVEVTDTTTAFSATSGTFQTLTSAPTSAVTYTTATANVLELAFDLTGNGTANDLDSHTDGTGLLASLGQTLSVSADTDTGYLVAYQDGKAYLYRVAESADAGAEVAAADIALVGVFNGIAVGGFAPTNFINAV